MHAEVVLNATQKSNFENEVITILHLFPGQPGTELLLLVITRLVKRRAIAPSCLPRLWIRPCPEEPSICVRACLPLNKHGVLCFMEVQVLGMIEPEDSGDRKERINF